MKASDLLVKALENEGVEFVFGIPGEENLDLLDSLSRSTIRLILTRHERCVSRHDDSVNSGSLTISPPFNADS